MVTPVEKKNLFNLKFILEQNLNFFDEDSSANSNF